MHDEQIGNYIREIAQSNLHTYSRVGIVTKVDKTTLTCTVKTADEKSYYTNVRLKEVADKAEEGFWMIPKIDSRVIINLVGYNQPYISMVSDIEEIHVVISEKNIFSMSVQELKLVFDEKNIFSMSKADGMQLVLDTGMKFTIKNSQEDLKEILMDLITAITMIYVPTGVGPSGFPLNNTSDFEPLKIRILDLFK